MTSVTGGALGYVSYQIGIIEGHLVHRYVSRWAPALCSRILFQTVLSLDVSTQTIFLYYISVIYTLSDYFLCFGVRCYTLVAMLNRWNQYNFSTPPSIIYLRAQVNSSTIVNIYWLVQKFKYQCCGFQVHFKSILVYNLKTKGDFWSKCPPYIMGYVINLGSMFFLFSLVLNLEYIDYSLRQIWSVYMQYLRCCDHSNKCLFLIIQQAEVLLNYFWVCNVFMWTASLSGKIRK